MLRLAGAFVLFACPLMAHEWYPTNCCSDQDCAPVSSDVVSWDGETFTAYLTPENFRHTQTGEPLVSKPVTHTLPMAQIEASPDGQIHVCAREHIMYCAWLPLGY